MDLFLENVEKVLLKLRKKRPWLADQTGISVNTVQGWFQNNRPPRIDDAYKVSKALGVSLEVLMGEEETEKQEYTDPDMQEICDFLRSQDKDDLKEIKGVLKMWKFTNSLTEKKRTNKTA